MSTPLSSTLHAQTVAPVPATSWRAGARADVVTQITEHVVEEVPVALVYNGIRHVVMLMTPCDLEDFAVGFSLTEGIVANTAEILSIDVAPAGPGFEMRIAINAERMPALLQRRRNMESRSGCGLCGLESLDQALQALRPVAASMATTPFAVHRALDALPLQQPMNAATGAVHAAAWVLPGGRIELVREDVGRHNALDKLIGAVARRHWVFAEGFLVVTSRASAEMAQKAAIAGIPMLVAISAPTALAIRIAEEAHLTLVGFARPQQHVVYTHPERLQGSVDS
jgi:formate dehydrogenase accessory protein FdhD